MQSYLQKQVDAVKASLQPYEEKLGKKGFTFTVDGYFEAENKWNGASQSFIEIRIRSAADVGKELVYYHGVYDNTGEMVWVHRDLTPFLELVIADFKLLLVGNKRTFRKLYKKQQREARNKLYGGKAPFSGCKLSTVIALFCIVGVVGFLLGLAFGIF